MEESQKPMKTVRGILFKYSFPSVMRQVDSLLRQCRMQQL